MMLCFIILTEFCVFLQLFALQTESRDQKDGDEAVQHKLPLYVQNMDRLGDTELWASNISLYWWLTEALISAFLLFLVRIQDI